MEHDDRDLVERTQKGEAAAFRTLVLKYQRRVYGIAYGILRNEQDAMDVTQEVFIKVHRHIDRFQGSSSFYTWLYRIVVNVCIDQVRKSSRSNAVDFDDSLDHGEGAVQTGGQIAATPIRDPGAELGRKELQGEIAKALDRLSEKHRQVILLREFEGLSYKEIAEILEISVGTVMSRLHHARQNMQGSLRRYLRRE